MGFGLVGPAGDGGLGKVRTTCVVDHSGYSGLVYFLLMR